jgi:hypothetical protein
MDAKMAGAWGAGGFWHLAGRTEPRTGPCQFDCQISLANYPGLSKQ